jgi:hypothetical protein
VAYSLPDILKHNMEKREMFENKTSTNDHNYDQNDHGRQAGDNDDDRKMPKDENADRETSEAYFGTNENNADRSSGANGGEQKDGLREEKESLKNSK